MAGYAAGDQINCYSIPIVVHKIPDYDRDGRPVLDGDGRARLRSGFRIGGGIDQDPNESPQGYPDKGVYVTFIYEGGPAQHGGLEIHDKILQVNGHDFTTVTHKKAVEYIGRKPVLNMLVYRKGIPPMQQQQIQQQSQYRENPQSSNASYQSDMYGSQSNQYPDSRYR